MTYEEYLESPEEMARYDILDGWKVYRLYGKDYMPSPTRRHQRIQANLGEPLRRFERTSQSGQYIPPPCDVRITLRPLRLRQPDGLFIGSERLQENPPEDEYSPLSPAPELVIEILSPSDVSSVQEAKLADYQRVDVRECWLVSVAAETVEVLQNQEGNWQTIAAYGHGQTVASMVFPGLTVSVDDIFTL
jgi:Uma2 family endonuclease